MGLVAIGVLLLVLNWFFHKVYWTEWIKGHRERSKELMAEGVGGRGGARSPGSTCSASRASSARVSRPSSSCRRCSSAPGTGIVLAGVTLGLLATAAVGCATFTLERKLPYKRC